jgi:hypothetical protein
MAKKPKHLTAGTKEAAAHMIWLRSLRQTKATKPEPEDESSTEQHTYDFSGNRKKAN